MLKNLPPLPHLPISLPKSVRDRLAQEVGSQDATDCPWITLSLVHFSYINEHQRDFEKCGISASTLDLVGSLGAAFSQLALFHLAYEDPRMRTPNDTARFVTKLKDSVLQGVANSLRLVNVAFVGHGVSGELVDIYGRQRLLSLLGLQLLGAVRICSDYKTLLSLVKNSAKELRKALAPVASYKCELQTHSQALGLRQPEYRVIEEMGPDHAKLFRVRVRTRDGKWAEGEGRSKKRAEKDAARQYMERFAPDYLAQRTQEAVTTDAQVRPPHVTPELHRREIEKLCQRFKVPPDKMWLLSQALVHASFPNETPLKNCKDNRMLAQLGSQVVITVATEVTVSNLLESVSPEVGQPSAVQVVNRLCSGPFISKGFDLLELEKAFLVGRGQSEHGIIDSIKADAFQAVIASIFLAHGTLEDAETFLPNELFRWLITSVETLVADPDRARNPKSKLQEQLQAIGMAWEYQIIHWGPDHVKEFEASIALSSHPTRRRIILKGGRGSSRRQAEQDIASLVSRAIDDINSRIGVQPIGTLLKDEGLRSFVRFLLRHEFASAPTSPVGTKKWHKEGMLGSRLLTQKREKRVTEFRLWANAVESLFREDKDGIPYSRVLSFYKALARPVSYDRTRHLYQEGIVAIRRLLEELDPEKQRSDVRQSHEFSEILSLSKMSRLLSREQATASLSDILDDFLLLRQGRLPVIQPTDHFPTLSISEREGTYQAMLNEILTILESENLSDHDVVSLSVVHKPEEMTLDFNFELPHDLKSAEETQRLVSESAFWKFLKEEIPITAINITPQEIHIRCVAYWGLMPDSFSTRALEAYHREKGFSRSENETISQLLHDLKNQLIAYQVALDLSGADRTSLLKSKYEASNHLDSAVSICRSLEAVGHAMSTPTIESLDIGEFFRQYVAQKITAVPPNIRIVPPITVESCEVWTAPEFLRSIIENLVKNSIEAMPDGGEIRLDWIFDQTEKSLLVEVTDTGPGIEDTLLERLLAGEPVESTKERGSGIGMVTVRTMLRGIGGTISAESVPDKGTRWVITLPSLEETDEPTSIAKTDDVETLLVSEKEADLQ